MKHRIQFNAHESVNEIVLAKNFTGVYPNSICTWRIRGFIVLDGWDPEGNVIQFKQVDPEDQ